MERSVFYGKRLKGLLTFLLVAGIIYALNLSSFLLAPFGEVSRFYLLFTITVGYLGMGLYALLLLIFATVMFVLTARLMEKKMNI